MVINSENLAALRRNFRALGALGIEQAQPQWNQVAMLAPSSGSGNTYGWIRDLPGMREWVGDRVLHNISEASYTISNRDFEATVSVSRNAILDDTIGIYSPMMQALGAAVAYSPDEIVFDLLPGGFTNKCWDGKPFFATDHPIAKGTNGSNKGTGALTAARFELALAQMRSLKNAYGKPLRAFFGTGDRAPVLVVGPSLDAVAKSIVITRTLPGGGDNPNAGSARLLVLPELVGDYAAHWFLLDTSKPVRPLILQRRKEPEFVALDDPQDPNVFNRREYVYGYDDRKAAGYGFWQLAYGSTGADA